MVIGVDAGALSITDNRLKVGVFKVIDRLLKELSQINSEHTYRLYSFQPIANDVIQQYSLQMTNLVLKPSFGWFDIRLPLSLLFHPVDLFLGVSQAVPFAAGRSIVFIYDLGFLHYPAAYPGSATGLKKRTQEAVNRSKHIITISEASKKDIIAKYSINPDKITVAYPGIDDYFTKGGEMFTPIRPYLLHVGSLKPGKNIPLLIHAFSHYVMQTKRDIDLYLIGGDYWLDTNILPAITACGLEERVRLLGVVPDALLPMYYRGASAFVSMSLSEGFCLPVLEAMACGVPVVASNVGSLPELAPEPELLCDPRDIVSFSKNLTRLFDDPELRALVKAKGIGKATTYSWKAFAETVYGVIQKFE